MKVISTVEKDVLDLEDGTYLLMLNRKGRLEEPDMTDEEYARNVFRMTNSGEMLWRIRTERDHFGFSIVFLFFEGDPRKVCCFCGYRYLVDLETGETEMYDYSP